MTSDSEQVLCYNKGCGKKFDPNNNGDGNDKPENRAAFAFN